jgi:RNA polymerase sigma-70 factor (ECF subfamily)
VEKGVNAVTRSIPGLFFRMAGHGSRSGRFREVYDESFPIISRVVYKIVEDLDVAEELCQEAFVRYYERMDTIPDADQAKFWLIRVAKNLALNFEKRRGREQKAYQRAFREPQSKPESGETLLLREESSRAVQEALNILPEKLRIVLVLKEYGNLNYKEIASALDISEGNVKVRVYRARERLARYLKEGDLYVP